MVYAKVPIQYVAQITNSLSLSFIVAVAVVFSPRVIPYGNDSSIMVKVKYSSPSDSSSSFIGILNDEQVTPAGNVTLYCFTFSELWSTPPPTNKITKWLCTELQK